MNIRAEIVAFMREYYYAGHIVNLSADVMAHKLADRIDSIELSIKEVYTHRAGREGASMRRAALMMGRYGGSFARAIGHAWLVADSYNAARLIAAFPELFERYSKMEIQK